VDAKFAQETRWEAGSGRMVGNTELIIPPGRATNEWRGRRDSKPRSLPWQLRE